MSNVVYLLMCAVLTALVLDQVAVAALLLCFELVAAGLAWKEMDR